MRLPPIFASMLRQRPVCIGLLSMAVVLIGANLLGIPLWRCAFHDVTGLPCPGCGVTRSMSALVRGRLQDAWHWHPFSPVLSVAGLMILLGCVLPKASRDRMAEFVETIERRTGITFILIAAFMGFGIWRIIACPQWP